MRYTRWFKCRPPGERGRARRPPRRRDIGVQRLDPSRGGDQPCLEPRDLVRRRGGRLLDLRQLLIHIALGRKPFAPVRDFVPQPGPIRLGGICRPAQRSRVLEGSLKIVLQALRLRLRGRELRAELLDALLGAGLRFGELCCQPRYAPLGAGLRCGVLRRQLLDALLGAGLRFGELRRQLLVALCGSALCFGELCG
jgi:hypothetical protein